MRAFNDAVFAEHDLFHIRRVGQVGEDKIDLLRDFFGRMGRGRTFAHQLIDDLAAAVVHNQFVSRFHEVARDRRTIMPSPI